MHIAGHDDGGEFLVDTHGAPIADPVFELFAETLPKVGPTWVLLERDNNLPPVAELLAENDRVRAVGQSALGL